MSRWFLFQYVTSSTQANALDRKESNAQLRLLRILVFEAEYSRALTEVNEVSLETQTIYSMESWILVVILDIYTSFYVYFALFSIMLTWT